VTDWLQGGMLKGPRAKSKAEKVAAFFADFPSHQSHAVGITRRMVEEQGLNVSRLEADQQLQDAVLSVHHASMHTLGGTPASKVVENHLSRAFVKIQQPVMSVPQLQIQPPPSS
jgi:hypothetical protein